MKHWAALLILAGCFTGKVTPNELSATGFMASGKVERCIKSVGTMVPWEPEEVCDRIEKNPLSQYGEMVLSGGFAAAVSILTAIFA